MNVLKNYIDTTNGKPLRYRGKTYKEYLVHKEEVLDLSSYKKVDKIVTDEGEILTLDMDRVLIETYLLDGFEETSQMRYVRYNGVKYNRYIIFSDDNLVFDLETLQEVKIQEKFGTKFIKIGYETVPYVRVLAETFFKNVGEKKKKSITVIDFLDNNPLHCTKSNIGIVKYNIGEGADVEILRFNDKVYDNYVVHQDKKAVYDLNSCIRVSYILDEDTRERYELSEYINIILSDTFILNKMQEDDKYKYIKERGIVNKDYAISLSKGEIFSRYDFDTFKPDEKGNVKLVTFNGKKEKERIYSIDTIVANTFLENADDKNFTEGMRYIKNISVFDDLDNVDFKCTQFLSKKNLGLNDCRTILIYHRFYRIPKQIIADMYDLSVDNIDTIVDKLSSDIVGVVNSQIIKDTLYSWQDANNIYHLAKYYAYTTKFIAEIYHEKDLNCISNIIDRKDVFSNYPLYDRNTGELNSKPLVLNFDAKEVNDIMYNYYAEHKSIVQIAKSYAFKLHMLPEEYVSSQHELLADKIKAIIDRQVYANIEITSVDIEAENAKTYISQVNKVSEEVNAEKTRLDHVNELKEKARKKTEIAYSQIQLDEKGYISQQGKYSKYHDMDKKAFNILLDADVNIQEYVDDLFNRLFNYYESLESLVESAQHLPNGYIMPKTYIRAILTDNILREMHRPSVADMTIKDRFIFRREYSMTFISNSTFTPTQINNIFKDYSNNITIPKLAEKYGASQLDIANILKRKIYTDVDVKDSNEFIFKGRLCKSLQSLLR